MGENYQFSNAVYNFFITATYFYIIDRISWSKQWKIKANDYLNATTMQKLKKKMANDNSNFKFNQKYFSVQWLLSVKEFIIFWSPIP